MWTFKNNPLNKINSHEYSGLLKFIFDLKDAARLFANRAENKKYFLFFFRAKQAKRISQLFFSLFFLNEELRFEAYLKS